MSFLLLALALLQDQPGKSKVLELSPRGSHAATVFKDAIWILGGTHVVVGKTATATFPLDDVWTTTDGLVWTRVVEHAAFGKRSGHSAVVFKDKLWVIAGIGDKGRFNDVWSSEDGATWTQVTENAAFPKRSGHTCAVFNDRLWVIAGAGEYTKGKDNYLNDVWSSEDGTTWTRAADEVAFRGRWGHASVVFDKKLWNIGYDVWSSPDGKTWTQTTSERVFPARTGGAGVVLGKEILFMGGWKSSGGMLNDVWTSPDGKTWTTAASSTAGFPPRTGHSAMLYKGKVWLLFGWDTTRCFNDVWVSGDGRQFTELTGPRKLGSR